MSEPIDIAVTREEFAADTAKLEQEFGAAMAILTALNWGISDEEVK